MPNLSDGELERLKELNRILDDVKTFHLLCPSCLQWFDDSWSLVKVPYEARHCPHCGYRYRLGAFMDPTGVHWGSENELPWENWQKWRAMIKGQE